MKRNSLFSWLSSPPPIFYLLVIMFSTVVAEGIVLNYYVDYQQGDDNSNSGLSEISAFQTIGKARDVIRGINQTSDIVVNLMDGYHYLDSTIVFDERDGGRNGYNIYYISYGPGEAIISGGVNVTSGWTQLPNLSIWKRTGITVENFRQLYVNGLREQRARSSHAYTFTGYFNLGDGGPDQDGLVVPPGNVPTTFANPADMEVVWQIDWRHFRHKVTGFFADSYNNTVIKLKNPEFAYGYYFNQTDSWYPAPQHPFYLENAYELLDQPGEWYYDRFTNSLYYWPREGVVMNTTEIYIPNIGCLIKVEGSSLTQKVGSLIFDGLTFKHSNWLRPSEIGFASWQAEALSHDTYVRWNANLEMMEAAVEVRKANYMRFSNNQFENIGSVAIGLYNGVNLIDVIGNSFNDISAAAVMIGNVEHFTIEAGEEIPKEIGIRNNVIRKAAQDYWSSPAISAYYVEGCVIGYNDISDVPYSGISLGWGWWFYSAQDELTRNNTIEYNRVTEFNKTSKDGGGIYVLGPQYGTNRIRYNYVSNSHNDFAGIYHDNGSSMYTTEHNVVENAPYWFVVNPYANNIAISNNYTDVSASRNTPQPADPTTIVLQNNSIISGGWPQGALNIINGAGVQPAYQGIVPSEPSVTNIAFGKPAIASSQWDANYSPSKAVDGSLQTGWSPSGTDTQPWIQLDLGSSQRIRLVEIDFRQDYNQPETRRNFEVQASNTSSFSTYSVLGEQIFITLLDKFKYSLVVDDPQSYRYVRVIKTKDEYFFATELRIYSD